MKKFNIIVVTFLLNSTCLFSQDENINKSPSKNHREQLEDYEKCEVDGEIIFVIDKSKVSDSPSAEDLEQKLKKEKKKNKIQKKKNKAQAKTIKGLKDEKEKLQKREQQLLTANQSKSAELKNVQEQIATYELMIDSYEKTRKLEQERTAMIIKEKDEELESRLNELQEKDAIIHWLKDLEENAAHIYFRKFEITPMRIKRRNGNLTSTKSYSKWTGTDFKIELGIVKGYKIPKGMYYIQIKDVKTGRVLHVAEGKGRAVQNVYFNNGIGSAFFPNYQSKTMFAWNSEYLVQLFYQAEYNGIIFPKFIGGGTLKLKKR